MKMKILTVIGIVCFALLSPSMAEELVQKVLSEKSIALANEGLKADQIGDYKKAMQLYAEAYQAGNPNVLKRMGSITRDGQGCEPDGELALQYFIKAVQEADSLQAVNAIANIYYYGRSGVPVDYKAALEMYNISAEYGDDIGRYLSAEMYRKGEGTVVDEAKAASLYNQVAQHQGTTEAVDIVVAMGYYMVSLMRVGYYYENGLYGFKKDNTLSLQYYKRAYNAYSLIHSGMKNDFTGVIKTLCTNTPDACEI